MARRSEVREETQGLMRIGELAERAGVARGTIQHYLREGLLPKPVKTHRNMAYYAPECVERIRLIKELQTRSYLPLSEIRSLLANGSGSSTLAQAIVHAQEAALKVVGPDTQASALSLKDAARQFGLRASLLEELVKLRLVSLRPDDDGKPVFSGVELEVLAAIAKLKEHGFTERTGFRADDLAMYRDALERLLQKEVQTFMRVLSSKRGAKVTAKLARSAVEGATLLLLALRKKSIVDLLSAAELAERKRPR